MVVVGVYGVGGGLTLSAGLADGERRGQGRA